MCPFSTSTALIKTLGRVSKRNYSTLVFQSGFSDLNPREVSELNMIFFFFLPFPNINISS